MLAGFSSSLRPDEKTRQGGQNPTNCSGDNRLSACTNGCSIPMDLREKVVYSPETG
jgi:hypothetical protein